LETPQVKEIKIAAVTVSKLAALVEPALPGH